MRGLCLSGSGFDHKQVAGRMVEQVLRDAAQHGADQAGPAMGADGQQVGTQLLHLLPQDTDDIALPQDRLDRRAGGFHPGAGERRHGLVDEPGQGALMFPLFLTADTGAGEEALEGTSKAWTACMPAPGARTSAACRAVRENAEKSTPTMTRP
jgi:hypothetical protein